MDSQQGVIAHITSDEASSWQMALRNLRNLAQNESMSIAPEQMEVVVNGPAVRFLLSSSPDSGKLRSMANAGVSINACSNSLGRFGYDPDNLTDGVTIVPSGVAEVVRAQEDGKNYLKLP